MADRRVRPRREPDSRVALLERLLHEHGLPGWREEVLHREDADLRVTYRPRPLNPTRTQAAGNQRVVIGRCRVQDLLPPVQPLLDPRGNACPTMSLVAVEKQYVGVPILTMTARDRHDSTVPPLLRQG